MVKPVVSFEDFAKLDLRVGKVIDVTHVSGSDKLYKLTIDLGSDYGVKTVCAGIRKWYTKRRLKGKKFIFVANLASRKVMGVESQGMMLATDASDRCVLIPVNSKVEVGALLR